jgi:metallo-beta-lactamase family protein
MNRARLTFMGAARTVTGSATLLEYNKFKVLVDCGMFQGPRNIRDRNKDLYSKEFAQNLDAIILTHAHVDHSAMIPKLFKLGFRGPVYCTQGTKDLAEVLLPDTAYLQEEDAKRQSSQSDKRVNPLYSLKEALESLKLFKVMGRKQWFELDRGLSFQFLRAGHILGSSLVQISLSDGNGVKIITFSGDLGNHRQNVIKGPQDVVETDYLVLESTYGDRLHSPIPPDEEIEKAIRWIAQSKGALLIPAFAVGRTQEILYIIKKIFEKEGVPEMEVYLDSPMALEATDLYLKGGEDIKLEVKDEGFVKSLSPKLFHRVRKMEDSIRLVHKSGPLIILSAAGMLTGGRILYHLKERLPDPQSMVLFVGYQAEETKGRLLQQGLKTIRIHRDLVHVKAKIQTVESLSAHADSDEIMEWLSRIDKKPQMIYLNHGDLVSSRALAYRIKYELGLATTIPEPGESFKIF